MDTNATPAAIHALLSEASSALSLQDIPEEMREEIFIRLGRVFWKRMAADMFDALSPEAREHCAGLSDAGDAEALYRFFTERVPNFENIVKESAAKTVVEFLKQ